MVAKLTITEDCSRHACSFLSLFSQALRCNPLFSLFGSQACNPDRLKAFLRSCFHQCEKNEGPPFLFWHHDCMIHFSPAFNMPKWSGLRGVVPPSRWSGCLIARSLSKSPLSHPLSNRRCDRCTLPHHSLAGNPAHPHSLRRHAYSGNPFY